MERIKQTTSLLLQTNLSSLTVTDAAVPHIGWTYIHQICEDYLNT